MSYYATLAQVKRILEMYGDQRQPMNAQRTDWDAYIVQQINSVSRRVDNLVRAQPLTAFTPSIRTVRIDPTYSTAGDMLILTGNTPLLAITSIGVTGTALASTDYYVVPDANATPITALQLAHCTTSAVASWFDTCQDCASYRAPYVEIAGVWGYHMNYAAAWHASVDTLQAAINTTTVTTLTVTDADGADWYGLPPRFSPGVFIRVGTEYMLVTSVNINTNVLTVLRGQGGSTATTHLSGAAVDVWEIDPSITEGVALQVGLDMARIGVYANLTVTPQGTIVQFPRDLHPRLLAALKVYINA
jgi:hypothetical protein